MDVKDFLSSGHVMMDVRARDKAGLIGALARQAGLWLDLPGERIIDALMKREALGSTGTGQGVALPHARLAEVRKPFGILVRLERGVDFDAIDGMPVDLLFLLLLPVAPSGDQLTALASVARKFHDPQIVNRLKNASTPGELYKAML